MSPKQIKEYEMELQHILYLFGAVILINIVDAIASKYDKENSLKSLVISAIVLVFSVSLQLADVETKVDTLIKQQEQIIQTLQVQPNTPILRPADVAK